MYRLFIASSKVENHKQAQKLKIIKKKKNRKNINTKTQKTQAIDTRQQYLLSTCVLFRRWWLWMRGLSSNDFLYFGN